MGLSATRWALLVDSEELVQVGNKDGVEQGTMAVAAAGKEKNDGLAARSRSQEGGDFSDALAALSGPYVRDRIEDLRFDFQSSVL